MMRRALLWGGAVAGVLALAAIVWVYAVAPSTSAEAHVERYLQALARDDLGSAARLADLPPSMPMPLGDAGAASTTEITIVDSVSDGDLDIVTARFGSPMDAALVSFALESAPPLLGLLPAWRFVEPPIATLTVAVDQHDRVRVNGVDLIADGAGESVAVTAFVPALLEARVAQPELDAEPARVRARSELSVDAGAPPIVLAASPSEVLGRSVLREVESLLADCSTHEVLLPAGCPFGVELDDVRVVAPPSWSLQSPPEISIEAGGNPGRWLVRGQASMRLVVDVQRLRDGAISERDEVVQARIRGEVVFVDGAPVVTFHPPSR